MVRAFIALELPDEIRERLFRAAEELRPCPARLTFVEQKNIHITVKFLGEVDDTLLPRVKDALSSIPFRPFELSVGDITVNDPKRPFTVWASITDGGESGELFRIVEDRLAPLGFGRERRRFTPHATIARIKVPHPSLPATVRSLAGKTGGKCLISGLKLKKSTLLPAGPVYEDLLEVAW